jgi:hypothetical protein
MGQAEAGHEAIAHRQVLCGRFPCLLCLHLSLISSLNCLLLVNSFFLYHRLLSRIYCLLHYLPLVPRFILFHSHSETSPGAWSADVRLRKVRPCFSSLRYSGLVHCVSIVCFCCYLPRAESTFRLSFLFTHRSQHSRLGVRQARACSTAHCWSW